MQPFGPTDQRVRNTTYVQSILANSHNHFMDAIDTSQLQYKHVKMLSSDDKLKFVCLSSMLNDANFLIV